LNAKACSSLETGNVETSCRLNSAFSRQGRGGAASEIRLWRRPATFQHLLTVEEEVWTGDDLQFRISALGQMASGAIDVADDHVRLTIVLPWLLAKLAEKIQSFVGNQTKLMLEKK
jgi:SpoVK/Ycf46/Vps4 family AAA+-type ATPase